MGVAAIAALAGCAQAFFGPLDRPEVRPRPRCILQLQWEADSPADVQALRLGDNSFPGERPCRGTEARAQAEALVRALTPPATP